MRFQQGTDVLAQQTGLDPISQAIQDAITRAYRSAGSTGRRVANAMYGTWLGHPFHPAVITVPIGAWAAGSALDWLNAVSGNRLFARCADASVTVGTLGALVAVASGLTDVQHPTGEARRIGMVHGFLNVTATLLQLASLVQRARGERGQGRLLSTLAFGGVLVSGYLGGEMPYRYQIGVNRAANETVPSGWVPVMPEAELPENEPRQVEIDGSPVVLVRQGDRIYAMHATCTHMGSNLARGRVVDGTVQCPWHGSRFALDDGHVVGGPASFPERCLATRVRNGTIEVGPGRGLGRCSHEPVEAAQAQPREEMAAAPMHR
jgi:nitrite reductase/ring-hydroxylating ferredoxin subunit/uncharacterized membrane protein